MNKVTMRQDQNLEIFLAIDESQQNALQIGMFYCSCENKIKPALHSQEAYDSGFSSPKEKTGCMTRIVLAREMPDVAEQGALSDCLRHP